MVIQGVIRPPPEIRAVADRTALYVAKNGRAFEARILSSEKGKTPKFAFLHATSPFHAYYEQRVQFYEAGGEDKDEDEPETKKEENEKPAEAPVKVAKSQKASVIDPVSKVLLEQRGKILKYQAELEAASKAGDSDKPAATVTAIPEPPALQFVNIVPPSVLTVAQIEKIQLVAQFAAIDGKNGSFLSQLTMREWNNPDFAFCQPRHGHFAYFSALVDAYRQILSVWTTGTTETDDNIKAMANNVDKCLEVAAYRAEYENYMEEQARKDDGVSSAAQIDWYDFVVVETIDFPVDEVVEAMPPPASLAQAATATKESEAMEESDEEDEQIRVVPSYQPRVVATQTNTMETVIDPITGKKVAVKDLPEHMRIQLLDPKWAEERKKFQEKQKDSNLVSGDVVASNLARLAQARGGDRKEHDLLTSETNSKRRLEEANRVIMQSQGVGPALPQPKAAPVPPSLEPAAKRPRIDAVTHVEAPPITHVAAPNVPPPPGFENAAEAASAADEPFASIGTGAAVSPKEAAGELLPEAEFAASLSKPEVTLQVRVPNDRTNMAYNFYGQIVSLSVNVMSTIKTVKQELSKAHLNSMPPNKMQLKNPATGAFLKDNTTLAAQNIGPSATLELVPRARGGRR